MKISHRLLRKKTSPDQAWGRTLLLVLSFRRPSRESPAPDKMHILYEFWWEMRFSATGRPSARPRAQGRSAWWEASVYLFHFNLVWQQSCNHPLFFSVKCVCQEERANRLSLNGRSCWPNRNAWNGRSCWPNRNETLRRAPDPFIGEAA